MPKRYPRWTSPKDRIDGTLLCLCGRKGKRFIHLRKRIFRGICSDTCEAVFHKYKRLREVRRGEES